MTTELRTTEIEATGLEQCLGRLAAKTGIPKELIPGLCDYRFCQLMKGDISLPEGNYSVYCDISNRECSGLPAGRNGCHRGAVMQMWQGG